MRLTLFLLALALNAASGAPALWIREPALSPDGKTIVFSYRGDLFTVPATGGNATALTSNPAHDTSPVWSPDGKTLAFASFRHGNYDVYTVSAAGGPVTRLTFHSAHEFPTGFSPDGSGVLFSGARLDARNNAQFPDRSLPELYVVPVTGGRPKQMLTTPALRASWNHAGTRLLYEDKKGYENAWRKHHQSSIARDIRMIDAATGVHTVLTTFPGEDRSPVWTPDDTGFFCLSERSGSFNVWRQSMDPKEPPVQLTSFTTHPVRFLSASRAGDLCFTWDGALYVLPQGETKPRAVAVDVAQESDEAESERTVLTSGATEMALSPDGREMAFVVRGEVYVASVEFGDTRRITSTVWAERDVTFSPDGKALLFAAEQGTNWCLVEARRTDTNDPAFFNAGAIVTRTVLCNGHDNQQPRWSPDGREIAYLENRTTLNVMDRATGRIRTVLPGDRNYSYADGDQFFEWSPDGKWFLVQFLGKERWQSEVGLVSATGKSPVLNLTQSGYEDITPHWGRDGRLMYWMSDRDGLAGNGMGGGLQLDVYAQFFTESAQDRFHLTPAEFSQVTEKEEEEEDAKPGNAAVKTADVVVDLEGLEDRKVRLTSNSSELLDVVMSADGETLYGLTQSETGCNLWQRTPRSDESRRLAHLDATGAVAGLDPDVPPPVALRLDQDEAYLYVLFEGQVHRVAVPESDAGGKSGSTAPEEVSFSAEFTVSAPEERAQLFEHVWRLTARKFYRADMHGVDWAGLKPVYAKFLPHISNNHDFAELLSEMLGELNASHSGAGYYPSDPAADETGSLGFFPDPTHTGAGVKVAEILAKGPLTVATSRLKAGMVIESINGVAIAAGAEWDSALNHAAGKPVMLGCFDPATARRWEQRVQPVTPDEEAALLYDRWAKQRRAEVERLSGGKLGYVHVKDMDDASYRNTFADVMGRYADRAGLIVDTRFNGGGELHDDLTTFLSGKRYFTFNSRGQVLGGESHRRWHRPVAILVDEGNYSDAHLFPMACKLLGIGTVVGRPVAGTGTAVWWETLQDPTLFFGIPEVGFQDKDGNFMENRPLEPDVSVENDYQSVSTGADRQLEKAVELLLKQ